MKMIFCPSPNCNDVVLLRQGKRRTCECGQSWGEYTDDLNAVIGGKAIPLGFSNKSFVHAVKFQPEGGQGKTFEAFVIPKHCPTIQRERK